MYIEHVTLSALLYWLIIRYTYEFDSDPKHNQLVPQQSFGGCGSSIDSWRRQRQRSSTLESLTGQSILVSDSYAWHRSNKKAKYSWSNNCNWQRSRKIWSKHHQNQSLKDLSWTEICQRTPVVNISSINSRKSIYRL